MEEKTQNFSNCLYIYNTQGWWPISEGRAPTAVREWKVLGAYFKERITLGSHKAYSAQAAKQLEDEILAFAQKNLLQ